MATATKGNTTATRRTSLIRTIQAGRRALRMDEPTYRTMLASIGGGSSLSAMSLPAMIKVVEHMRKCGFKVRAKAGDRSQASDPFSRKVRALWLFLHSLGVVQDPSERALSAYVKRIVKVEDLRWVKKGSDQEIVIESLKKWAMRYLPAAVAERQREVAVHVKTHDIQMSASKLNQLMCQLGSDEGFDRHWQAWERCMEVLALPLPVREADNGNV